MAEKLLIWC